MTGPRRQCGRLPGRILGALALGAAVGYAGAPANAFDEPDGEKVALKACEQKLCSMVVGKSATGEDLSCALSKTWAGTKIKEGIEKQKLTWSFGDARCSVTIAAKRPEIIDAVSKPDHTLQFDAQTVKCEVERDKEITPINITLAPKLQFKNGKAEKAWLNVTTIEAPTVVKGAIWTAAQLEQNFGLFHGIMISEINEFIGQKCPKAVAGN
jgi:hypothetical protein